MTENQQKLVRFPELRNYYCLPVPTCRASTTEYSGTVVVPESCSARRRFFHVFGIEFWEHVKWKEWRTKQTKGLRRAIINQVEIIYFTNFFKNDRWKSDRIVSLINLFFFSGSSFAWFRNTTSSFHRRFSYTDRMLADTSIGRGIRSTWLTLADVSSLVRSGLLLRALSCFSFSSMSFSSCNFLAWAAARSARIRSSSACSSFSSSSSSSLSSSSLSESSSLTGKQE